MSTVLDSPTRRAALPTTRGRQTQTAIDSAARTVNARKGIPTPTIADIASEAGRSTASFYHRYDSKEVMVSQWALRFRDEVGERAEHWSEISFVPTSLIPEAVRRAQSDGYCADDDPAADRLRGHHVLPCIYYKEGH